MPTATKRRATRTNRMPRTVTRIMAQAVERNGHVLPTWPERGTGRTAPLATCGHCGGKPLIIRLCGKDAYGQIRHCAVCEKCGSHRKVEAVGQPVIPPATAEQRTHFGKDTARTRRKEH